ncbi:unnamed protein product [Orchesella dallaii]|uniref:Uncharacterized protein n=1 Tax=Orchesella dallaii TaxID=48710 RepID=A0ABP1RC31_9HEXA
MRLLIRFGYSLKMKMYPNVIADTQTILELVRGSMPNATLSTLPLHPNKERVFGINLPEDGYSSNSMSNLFSHLTKFKDSLGIQGFSVSSATLDEVFLAYA